MFSVAQYIEQRGGGRGVRRFAAMCFAKDVWKIHDVCLASLQNAVLGPWIKIW